MTLIVTAANKKYLYQVADTRLTTYPDGKLADNNSVKQVQVKGDNFCFLLSYTGIATINGIGVHDWVTNELSSYGVKHKSLNELLEYLKTRLKACYKDKYPLFLVGLGWTNQYKKSEIFVFKIHNEKGKFVLELDFPKEDTLLRFDGYKPAINEAYFSKRAKKLKKLLKRTKEKNVKKTLSGLVSLIRIGAEHKKHGKFIGHNCTSLYTEIDNFNPTATHHSIGKTKNYYPNSVSDQLSMKNIIIKDTFIKETDMKINPIKKR